MFFHEEEKKNAQSVRIIHPSFLWWPFVLAFDDNHLKTGICSELQQEVYLALFISCGAKLEKPTFQS